jgi:hypothetical protein
MEKIDTVGVKPGKKRKWWRVLRLVITVIVDKIYTIITRKTG